MLPIAKCVRKQLNDFILIPTYYRWFEKMDKTNIILSSNKTGHNNIDEILNFISINLKSTFDPPPPVIIYEQIRAAITCMLFKLWKKSNVTLRKY